MNGNTAMLTSRESERKKRIEMMLMMMKENLGKDVEAERGRER